MKRQTVLLSLLLAAVGVRSTLAEGDAPAPATDRKVRFAEQIRPIFQRACLRCHGPEKQKSGYRLDVREVALAGGDSYAPNIRPGKSADSPLMQFVTGQGDLLMPPEGERLSDREIELLRDWIDQGAPWPDELAGHVEDKRDWWSLKPLTRPEVPRGDSLPADGNPIDRFVEAKLREHQLSSSPVADRRTLIRRMSFDLTGLPPTPEDVDSFVADPDPNAVTRLVDRLLDSPRYGERWARHWLDAAHFAETHGNDQDRIREHAWPYRDYLIQAFNEDTPYGRFIQEQTAADALFPDEPRLIPALGFLAAGPWDESSLRDIREDTLDRQIARYLDRDDMLATVINNVCSLTIQCARCHDHKFDPIDQRDYYALQAVFSGVERANRKYDPDPAVQRERLALQHRQRQLQSRSAAVMEELLSARIQGEVDDWERRRERSVVRWYVLDADTFTSSDGATLTKLADGSILSGGTRPEKDTVTIVSSRLCDEASFAAGPGRTGKITAVRLEVLTDDSLPLHGPGRQDNGNLHLSEFELFVDDRTTAERLVNPVADFDQQDWGIARSIDGVESTAWGIYPKVGMSHRAVFELQTPIAVSGFNSGEAPPAGSPADRLRIVVKQLHGRGHLIGRLRISVTDALPPFTDESLPDEITSILALARDRRTEAQRLELAHYQQLGDVSRQISQLPRQELVYAAAADFEPDGSLKPPPGPRPIQILHRGDIRQPRQAVGPGALACVDSLPHQFDVPADGPESLRRAELARWLTRRDNPLTWRSIVNRVWHHHFGRGLVGTLNDFGHMGEQPSHPELLDWLAVEFRDNGQSLKQLHRLILTSHTYLQAVTTGPAHDATAADLRQTVDADNRLLWRMNRIRLDAESVHDAVLAISGRLDLRMGGPSDRQFDLQPGIHVTPRVDYSVFDQNSELGRRRSIYRFLFRTLPDPFMESLDCPSGDLITPARTNSVTVQQALALWNDRFIAAHCEQIAARLMRDVPAENNDDQVLVARVQRAVQLILCRPATAAETAELTRYAAKHGLANLCRLLLNTNEFMFVN